ncbi:hypothetical protein [Kosakonia cowanii]
MTIHIRSRCWWLARNGPADALPEDAARQGLRMPKRVIRSVTREIELVPGELFGSEIV